MSPQQIEVVRLMGLGYTSGEASVRLRLSENTVAKYAAAVRRKYNLAHIKGPVAYTMLALRQNLFTVEELVARISR